MTVSSYKHKILLYCVGWEQDVLFCLDFRNFKKFWREILLEADEYIDTERDTWEKRLGRY